jgi:hypothetical protein
LETRWDGKVPDGQFQAVTLFYFFELLDPNRITLTSIDFSDTKHKIFTAGPNNDTRTGAQLHGLFESIRKLNISVDQAFINSLNGSRIVMINAFQTGTYALIRETGGFTRSFQMGSNPTLLLVPKAITQEDLIASLRSLVQSCRSDFPQYLRSPN